MIRNLARKETSQVGQPTDIGQPRPVAGMAASRHEGIVEWGAKRFDRLLAVFCVVNQTAPRTSLCCLVDLLGIKDLAVPRR
jgi:hypothetical protein